MIRVLFYLKNVYEMQEFCITPVCSDSLILDLVVQERNVDVSIHATVTLKNVRTYIWAPHDP